ncbi:MAG: GNAT family N-acetyltransferase [Clostridiales bacterium]|nr:GNAT family N-acetyltransferase [Clostridiales bacterium]
MLRIGIFLFKNATLAYKKESIMNNFKYTLRAYTKQDYEFVYYTKKEAYKIYVEANWGKWNEEQQRKMFVQFIDTYGKDIKIIMEADKKIGFYHVEELENGDCEIGNICIIPEFQGRGIGTKILKDILETHKNKDIYLRYFKQNPVAKLYKRLGFEMIEEMPYHFKMVLKAKEKTKE